MISFLSTTDNDTEVNSEDNSDSEIEEKRGLFICFVNYKFIMIFMFTKYTDKL